MTAQAPAQDRLGIKTEKPRNKGGAPLGNQNALGNNGGRPSSYKPEYGPKAIELGKEGNSAAQIAAEFGVSKQTVFDWAKRHVEFADCLACAKTEEQRWWEDKAQKSLTDRDFNSHVWAKSMAARFKDDYTERKEVTGKDGGAIELSDQDPRDLARAVLGILTLADLEEAIEPKVIEHKDDE